MPHSTPSFQIPVIDIASPDVETAKELVKAASEYGFIFVRNTDKAGIPDADIDGMFELSKSFFQSPVEVKETCSINSNEGGKNRGWLGMGVETLDPGKQKVGCCMLSYRRLYFFSTIKRTITAQDASQSLPLHLQPSLLFCLCIR